LAVGRHGSIVKDFLEKGKCLNGRNVRMRAQILEFWAPRER
jgi:hypothetical protein